MLSGDTSVRGTYGWESLISLYVGAQPSTTARKYTLRLANGGTSKKTWEVIADRPHLWGLANGESTYDLREGDVIPANRTDCGYSPEGWLHGYLKRQGFSSGVFSLARSQSPWHGRLHQCSLNKVSQKAGTDYTFPDFPYQKWPYELDKTYQGAKYCGSFVQGFMDGGKAGALVAFNTSEAAWWFYKMAPFGGYVATGAMLDTRVKTEKRLMASEFHTVYRFSCVKGSNHSGFRVAAIDPLVGTGLYLPERSVPPQPICLEGGIQALF